MPDTGPGVTRPVALAPGQLPDAVYNCGKCHNIPPPGILTKSQWPTVIEAMIARVEANALGPSPTKQEIAAVIAYYQQNAPDQLAQGCTTFVPSPLVFSASLFGSPPPAQGPGTKPPIVGHIRVTDLDGDARPDVLVCDSANNLVIWMARDKGVWKEATLAQVNTPVHAEAADILGTGQAQIVVASLGGMTPTEDPVGAVYLIARDNAGRVGTIPLLTGAPRVSDVRPADLDGDGDLDIVVGAYGMYRTGGVIWLEQTAKGSFTPRVLKQVNGVGFVPTGDLNGDGKPDIVALVSQQHEQVLALVNAGGGKFEERVLWQAQHPLYGCASAELVDLDRDGDLDVLFANGDALDFDTSPKPYHGVQWLENHGSLKFEFHDLTRFYGAYRTAVGDLDADGDLDIVATSMSNHWDRSDAQAIIWLENDGRQRFTVHPISPSPTCQVAAEIGDFSGDGRPDILTGGMYVLPPYKRVGRVTLWTNGGAAH